MSKKKRVRKTKELTDRETADYQAANMCCAILETIETDWGLSAEAVLNACQYLRIAPQRLLQAINAGVSKLDI